MYRSPKELIAAHKQRPKHRDEKLIETIKEMAERLRFFNPIDPDVETCYLGGVCMTITQAAEKMGYA